MFKVILDERDKQQQEMRNRDRERMERDKRKLKAKKPQGRRVQHKRLLSRPDEPKSFASRQSEIIRKEPQSGSLQHLEPHRPHLTGPIPSAGQTNPTHQLGPLGPSPQYPSPYAMQPMTYWPQYYFPQQQAVYYPVQTMPRISLAVLRDLLSLVSSDKTDLESVENSRDTIPPAHRGRAEQVVNTREFRQWLVSGESKGLLIEGNFRVHDSHYISALSLVCATLARALRTREKYISVVFFCGCHIAEDQEDDEENDGDGRQSCEGVAIMKSAISQLLEQCSSIDLAGLESDINLTRVKDGDLRQLCSLFTWLLKRLPEDMVLVCLIDGAAYYETEDHEDEFLESMSYLLGLCLDASIIVPVKVLVTSPTPTDSIQELFEDDDQDEFGILSLESLPEINWMYGIAESDEETSEDSDKETGEGFVASDSDDE